MASQYAADKIHSDYHVIVPKTIHGLPLRSIPVSDSFNRHSNCWPLHLDPLITKTLQTFLLANDFTLSHRPVKESQQNKNNIINKHQPHPKSNICTYFPGVLLETFLTTPPSPPPLVEKNRAEWTWKTWPKHVSPEIKFDATPNKEKQLYSGDGCKWRFLSWGFKNIYN